jgi:ribosomal protein S18 acetylase RimI-like enzyme
MSYRVLDLNAEDFLRLRSQLVDIYRTAFGEPPYFRTEVDALGFSESLLRHINRSGFASNVALDDDSGLAVGFAYGYTSLPGQWWYDVVTQALSPEATEQWVKGSFELVELAVMPSAQGHHLGSYLHDQIIRRVAHPNAVLSTMQADTVASRLYLKRGWRPLVENFHFPGVSRPYQIMALDRSRAEWLLSER